QAAILPTPPTAETSVAVDVVPSIGWNVGLAIANTGAASAAITLTLRDPDGAVVSSPMAMTIGSKAQIARFVTELFPPNVIGRAFRGSMTLQSSTPVSVIALRFSGALFSTVPVTASDPASAGVVVFPQFAISGGWATTLSLMNNTSNRISGRIEVFDSTGAPMRIPWNGETESTFLYSLPPRGSTAFAPRDVNGQSPF